MIEILIDLVHSLIMCRICFSPPLLTGVSKLRQLSESVCLLFNVSAHTDKQLRKFKTVTLTTLAALLSHTDFIAMVSAMQRVIVLA